MKMVIGKKTDRHENGEFFKPFSQEQRVEDTPSAGKVSEMKEVKSKRGQKTKLYSDGKNRMRAEFYDSPVHFYDEESGEFEEIDNTFSDNGETLETRKNTFKARFNKNPSDGRIFEMEKNLCKVSLKSRDVQRCGKCNMEVCECHARSGEKNNVLIKNATENTDIEYIVDSERIKENIIVKERADKYEYDFDLSLDNLAVSVSEDGKSLELTKKDSGRLMFYIPSPVMFDSNGESSECVYYEIEQDDSDEIKIKVVADAEWINADNRAFPVTIDPQIVSAPFYGSYYNTSGYNGNIFRFTQFSADGQKEGSLKLYYKDSPEAEIHSTITILKDRLPSYMVDNLTKATLWIMAKYDSKIDRFSIDYNTEFEEGREFTVDITHLFFSSDNEVEVLLSNSSSFQHRWCRNDIEFYPPALFLEYAPQIKEIYVTREPNKKKYLPGEKFDKTGMQIMGKCDDGSPRIIPLDEVETEPHGTLATYDESVKIIYKGENGTQNISCRYDGIEVEKGDYWFNDRRSAKTLENVYRITDLDGDGNASASSKLVRLEHADGVSDEEGDGTPLNAKTFNKIIKALKDKGILD